MSESTDKKSKPLFVPSLEEIREGCLAIQAEWSSDEKARRGRGTK